MATKTFKSRIQNKHDTEAHWNAAVNFKPLAGELIIYDEDDTHSTPRLKIGNGNTLVNNLPFIPTVSTLGQTGQLKDGVQDTTHRLVTDTEKSTWNSKQTQLTDAQLNAVNSGITATKVSTYDGYATAISNKVDKATGKSLVYVNSGTGVPTTIGFAENTAPPSSMVRRNTDGAVVATNLATPFNNITKLSDNLGKRLTYVGGDKTINGGLSKITINSNIYDIDFNGATITVNFDERPLVANTYDGLLKGHSHCVIRNLNLKVIIKPFSTNTALTEYNVLDKFGGIENSLITINSNEVTGGTVSITLRGIANADHIANTKVDLKCYTERVTAICYSYCNYLFWCRADGADIYSMYGNPLGKFYNFAECNYLTNCQDLSSYGYSAITDYEQQRPYMFLNCSYLTNCSFIFNSSDVFSVSTVGKSPLDSIQDTNNGKTKAYVKPAGGSGITPAIDVDTDPNGGTIVRRLTDGQIRAADAKANTDLTTLKQVNTIVSSYTQGNPTESGTVDLTKLKVGNTVYNIPQGGSDINVVQSMGQSTTDVMSQKAVTDSLANKASTSYVQGNPLGSGTTTLTKLKVGNTIYNVPQGGSSVNVVQTTGQSTTAVMSQKAVTDELNGKVDKVTGKGLSTNDFTDAEKTKLAGIETGAEVNEIDTITAGENITVSKDGKNVTISATGGGGGTTVVANPTLTGSEANLTALQVGATKYGIKTLKVTIW